MRIVRRIYVIEVNCRPMEMYFKRERAGQALLAYRSRAGVARVVPYAPLLPARRKKR